MTSPTLNWTAQFTVTPPDLTSKLVGDKIILPQSALEQLLSAATVTVVSDPQPGSYDSLNPNSRAAYQANQVFERRQNLPQPLTFRLVNPINGNVVYAGIREFSANDDEVGLSPFLRTALGLEDDGKAQKLTIHAEQLPKGTFVRFRPLEAGYDPEDWKALLERQLRNTFTTLTKKEILTIQSGKQEFRFLVDEVQPEGDGVCIVDTDLEVDIEALNEGQARETLKKKLGKVKQEGGAIDGISSGDVIVLHQAISAKTAPGDYVDFILKGWDRALGLEIELEAREPDAVGLFVSPFKRTQRNRPREDEHVFSEISNRPSKSIKIQHTNSELEGSEALYVSVRGYAADNSGLHPTPFTLSIRPIDSQTSPDTTGELGREAPNPDEIRCNNCHQYVPQRTLILHENFCYRNNVLCAHCKNVFKKSSDEWKNHWHCPQDEAYGDSAWTQHKHDKLFHTPTSCKSCGYSVKSPLDLALHRTSTCPEKVILCQFCHLLVPQQGPEDLQPTDPGVVLSSLTPHEYSEGSTTTECHMCGKITRLRDMVIHLRHHFLDRLSRTTPRRCRNVNCGRTMDGVGPNGQIKQAQPSRNDIGLCDTCFGPLYNSSFDPEHRALRRRVERRYLTQFLTGCGNDWCRNEFCKTGRRHMHGDSISVTVTSKEAMDLIKPILVNLTVFNTQLHFCTDEASQHRRLLAEMIAASNDSSGDNDYSLPWCLAALEAESGDLDHGRDWLSKWAPKVSETR